MSAFLNLCCHDHPSITANFYRKTNIVDGIFKRSKHQHDMGYKNPCHLFALYIFGDTNNNGHRQYCVLLIGLRSHWRRTIIFSISICVIFFNFPKIVKLELKFDKQKFKLFDSIQFAMESENTVRMDCVKFVECCCCWILSRYKLFIFSIFCWN